MIGVLLLGAGSASPLSGLPPQISVLGISIGLLLALICYLVTNLSPGGMITPGWIAIVLVEKPAHILLIGATIILTSLIMRRLQKVVILYGKRLFATVVMIAVFFQMTFFLFLVGNLPTLFENSTLGFIIPGLVAYQLIRQPPLATITAMLTVSAITYGIMLTGAVLGLIPEAASPGALAAAAGEGTSPLRVVHLLVAVSVAAVGLGVLWLSLRRIDRDLGHPDDVTM